MNKIIILIFLLPLFGFSQDCNCTSNFKWVVETFEKNDAGFKYIIDTKGEQAYKRHNHEFFSKLEKITTKVECYELMRDWMNFFRKGHFGIRPVNENVSSRSESNNNDWETININVKKFKKLLKNKKNIDYEGIWKSDPYLIGIKKIDNVFKGFIIEANGSKWKKGEIKLIIYPNKSSTYYMGDYSSETFKNAMLLGNKYLQLGFITLERVVPKCKSNPTIERYYKSISAEKPYLEKINANTLLLRISSFDSSQKKILIAYYWQIEKQSIEPKT